MRGELSIGSNILLYRKRIVVPKSLQQETLQKMQAIKEFKNVVYMLKLQSGGLIFQLKSIRW